jgi:hypothetical protein
MARIYGTQRKFKQEKRAQLKAVEDSMAELQLGIAYAPDEAYNAFDAMALNLKVMKSQMSQQAWGR